MMSMERHRGVLAAGMLAMVMGMVAGGSGCRTPRSEVPPGPRYSTTGDPSAAGFNSEPRGMSALNPYGAANQTLSNSGMAGGIPGMPSPGIGGPVPGATPDGMPPASTGMPGLSGSSYGTPAPGGSSPGMPMPTGGSYGPPGTSGR